MYWVIISSLLVWIAVQNEEEQRLRYADAYLRADIHALRERVLGL